MVLLKKKTDICKNQIEFPEIKKKSLLKLILSVSESGNLGKGMKNFNLQFRKQNKFQRRQTKRNAHQDILY